MLRKEELDYFQKLSNPVRESTHTHNIYSYPAKFLSHLPRGLIVKLSQNKGDLICDPFAGGGTTGLEAMLLDRRFIGYDINPFSKLVSNVKTTYISPKIIKNTLNKLIEQYLVIHPKIDILDQTDKMCLGDKITLEINGIATYIKTEIQEPEQKSFFRLALIHVTKIIGRRDFELRNDWKNISLTPIFIRKCNKMIDAVNSLPKESKYLPEFRIGSNHEMKIPDEEVDLIITSPPYLDVDVEYQKLQLQRRSLKKSKRSEIISQILETEPLSNSELCWKGEKGERYWRNLEKSLDECYRVLKNKRYLCLWTGFKKQVDEKRILSLFDDLNFALLNTIPIKLSSNRAASSRSTHHKRKTGMMKEDYLFLLQKS
ncbi:MAG: DNA methyltransferase [Candidatus Hodarchaeales archaeon]